MSDKKEVRLNEVDIQAVIAAWIIANDGCGSSNDVDCCGDRGIFKGTACLFYRHTGCIAPGDMKKVGEAKAWLEKYHQQKADDAETEKQKAETAKKEEPRKICGTCRHVPVNIIDLGDVQRTVSCEKKGINVPAYLEGCHEFEPRTATDQPRYVFVKNGMDAAACAESVVQRKKDTEELCDLVELYAAAHAESKRAHFETKKDRDDLAARCERLTEQLNRLSNSLIEQRSSLVEAMRRVKEVERENSILAKSLVDCKASMSVFCVEKDREVDRLRKENVELLSRHEQLQKDSFRQLYEALCKTKVLEKQIDRLLGDQLLMERKMQICISAS